MKTQLVGTLTGYKKRIIQTRPVYYQGGKWYYTDTRKPVRKGVKHGKTKTI